MLRYTGAMRRRDLLLAGTAALSPAFVRRAYARPLVSHGVQSGDVLADRAIIWSRADRPSRMMVEWSTKESMADARRLTGPYAMENSGFTARMDLRQLPAGQSIFYRVQFLDLRDGKTLSEPVSGHVRTAPAARRGVRFLWSGDTAGQGYGINPDWGGMRIYETMRKLGPDFFLHSGDTIYADNLIPAEVPLPDGTKWRNLTTEATSKVAETLDEFRGNYLYNLMDENVRRFNAEVPQIWQWDDHEVMNNWSPGKDLSADARYSEKSVPLLVARATHAFLEHAPMRFHGVESERVYRRISYGPLLDVFVIDMRSYRAANSHNRQTQESEETVYLGRPQIEWLKQGLRESRATWKVIASDMPLGLVVGDGRDSQGRPRYENSANGDGPPLGRELEIASLLGFLKQNRVRNTVWLTADVHYTAAHYYDPAKAQFTGFDPFWEFVSGPLNAGTFGPGVLENTFGPQLVFQKAPDKGKSNLPPSAGLQFFGEVKIEAANGAMVVNLRDVAGQVLYSKTLNPAQ
ncbi:MAG: alkaline phosphatase D family protein [Acidobacteriia bacterium]|nr:alkaline phosphatase D family protein [Terriglobia bacterium]